MDFVIVIAAESVLYVSGVGLLCTHQSLRFAKNFDRRRQHSCTVAAKRSTHRSIYLAERINHSKSHLADGRCDLLRCDAENSKRHNVNAPNDGLWWFMDGWCVR